MAEEIKKLIDIAGLTKYHENLTHVLKTKADEAAADATSKADAAKAAAIESAAADATSKANAAQAAAEATAAADATTKANAAEQNAKSYADGKFQVAGNYETAGAAAQALADAKEDAAEKYQVKGDYETAGAAAAALDSAKSYVDGKVDGKFDAAGAAAQALADAKTYVNGKVDGKFDAAGTAAGLNTAMDARVKVLEAIDHAQLVADASADAVAKVLDGAPEKFDTLKEVAQWISDSESASDAADLVTRVKALEDIDHDAYIAADETVLASAKSYADGLATNYDKSGAAAQALVDAKAYVDGKGYLIADDFGFAKNDDIDALFQ